MVEPESHVPPDIAAMLSRMADLYQELLRNKEQEITALRQALDVTELSAANERRELEMLNRLTKMMERENQRLTAELEEARHQLGQTHARRGLLARLFGGGEEEASSASHSAGVKAAVTSGRFCRGVGKLHHAKRINFRGVAQGPCSGTECEQHDTPIPHAKPDKAQFFRIAYAIPS